MKKSIIRRAIAVFIAAAMLAGCAAQDSGVLSSQRPKAMYRMLRIRAVLMKILRLLPLTAQ